ncbi:DUF3566 domain-containing protein [Streptomyces sp. AGS-58]|uniref:DUF3566 domain-containing protein n=1 Tax=unclassified Streptomyces TaxID=2593676 RepID=UPI0035A27F58
MREGDPWSVMVMSFLFLAGLGAVVTATALVLWMMLEVMAPGTPPSLTAFLFTTLGVVTMEVVLGTALATLCTFIYNLSALYNGGVEVTLTADLTDPTPAAARALLLAARVRARARRHVRARTPHWLRRALNRLPPDGS